MSDVTPGQTLLLMGPPGSGKSTLARQALEAHGSGIVCLAPGLSEEASYRKFRGNEAVKVKGFDDPNFFPSEGSLVATGYRELIGYLRGVYKALKEEQDAGKPLRFKVLVTDTFNSMSTLAMNQTLQHLGVDMPPPAMSPTGAAFWGYQRNLQEQLTRACRSIRGLGLDWIATCHVAEKEAKDTAIANPDRAEDVKGKASIVPAISGGFRDVLAGEFDLVLHCGVTRNDKKEPVHYLQWQPSAKRPTKSRYGALATAGKIPANWNKLQELLRGIDA